MLYIYYIKELGFLILVIIDTVSLQVYNDLIRQLSKAIALMGADE